MKMVRERRGSKAFQRFVTLSPYLRPARWQQYISPTAPAPRTYPVGFGVGLREIMTTWRPQPHLRQKVEVNTNLSDRELFQNMPLGKDLWHDAQLVEAYRYIRKCKKHSVPNSWQSVFEDLDAELDRIYPQHG